MSNYIAYTQITNKSLYGAIVDNLKQPIEFVPILLLKADSSFLTGSTTDEKGQFSFGEVPEEAAILRISSLEYGDTAIALKEINQLPLIIQMDKKSHVLAEVAVTGKKPLLEQKEDRLIMNMSASHSTAGSSALQLLSRVPGVVVDQQGGSLSLTGKQGVLVMINNRLTRAPINILMSQLEGMQADHVDRIEVIHQPPAKYNAGGTGGIIHLVLKKDETQGINGNFGLMAGYGQREKYGADGRFNLRKKNLNIYGDANYTRRISDEKTVNNYRRFEYSGSLFEHNIDNFFNRQENSTLGGRLGLDYNLSERTTLGILVGGGDNAFRVISDAHTTSKINQLVTDEFIYNINTNILNAYFYGNINLFHQFEKNSLNIDADYAQYNLSSPGRFSHLDGEAGAFPTQFRVDRRNPLRLYTYKVDYTKNFGKGHRLEVGSKVSLGTIGNDADIQNFQNGGWQQNETFSVVEDIHENLYAGYLSFVPKLSEKISVETGLRYEFFDYWVENQSSEIDFSQSRGSLFPVLRFNYKIDSINTIQIGYNRRVNRPAYNQLGAQFVFIDPTSVTSGNPRLRPAFASAVRAAWTHKSIFTSLEFTRTQQFIGYHNKINKEENTLLDGPHNFDQFDLASLTVSLPIHLGNWSDIHLTAIGQLRHVKDEMGREARFERRKTNIIWQYNQSIRSSKTFSADINGNRIADVLVGDQIRLDIFNVNVGFNKKFNDGSTLNLAFMDLLNQSVKISGLYEDPSLDVHSAFLLQWSERQVRLKFSMPFGSQKIKKHRNRKTANEEERRRVG